MGSLACVCSVLFPLLIPFGSPLLATVAFHSESLKCKAAPQLEEVDLKRLSEDEDRSVVHNGGHDVMMC